ncbi:MAG: acyltransferase [Bacteroidetes bacterium]|nr:acyltransferase [Bacteroidota bacterium]
MYNQFKISKEPLYFAAQYYLLLAKEHYKTLDAIRFIAFFKVFLLHLPDGTNTPIYNFIKMGGGTGVAIFFVLSGFLISDILIKEKAVKGSINPGNFFWRRAFRIWPLYFLGVILAYIGIAVTQYLGISNSEGYMPKPFYSFLFLENYHSIFEGTYPRGVPLQVFWSLCIEEHFYLLWLLIFVLIPLKHFVKTMGSLWVVSICCRIIALNLLPQYKINGAEIITSLDYFIAGGLVACYKNNLIPQFINRVNYITKLSIFILSGLFLVFQHLWFDKLGIFGITISAIIYGACIFACVVKGDERLTISDKAMISRMGVISYGLYVFHTPVIMFLYKVFEKIGFDYHTKTGLVVFFIIALSLSILISNLSYKYYESWFLKIREKLWT